MTSIPRIPISTPIQTARSFRRQPQRQYSGKYPFRDIPPYPCPIVSSSETASPVKMKRRSHMYSKPQKSKNGEQASFQRSHNLNHGSAESMKNRDRAAECSLRDHMKSGMQGMKLILNSESHPDADDFWYLAERVPRHDFVSNTEICRNSRPGTVSKRGWNQSLCHSSFFFLPLFKCFPVRLFDCFHVPSSFSVPCSIFFLRREKIRIFTLIELLIVIAIIAILLRSKCGFFMAFYGNSVF